MTHRKNCRPQIDDLQAKQVDLRKQLAKA